ncbi:TPA: hypothetical protein KD863_004578 [Vibrio parahaemolyticus]|uniref:hypothetical protein n=1 Tax=Vibrio harveyi TaxID=669 RepID=UPI001B8416D9|nr:hypothetical protein [Vibrio vulnificus]MDF5667853.1 hypothetical protein [Vibrio parahaemolyticus]MDW1971021.1 hypothetical protein [Vibrio sp. 945]HBC3836203.1 hypothetical protein [Vibrio parahaemolyticus]
MSAKNRFAATSEQDAEDQLKALYGGKPVRTGSTTAHRMTWFVKNRQVTMARRSTHKNGRGEAMFIVEVK